MQSIIVYRNPLEAAIWGVISSGDIFPFIVGVVVFFVVFLLVFLLANIIIERNISVYTGYPRRRNPRYRLATFFNLFVSTTIGLFVIWYMM